MAELHQILCAYCLWPWLGPPLMRCDMLCTSGFVDDVMFSYLESNTTLSLEEVRQVAAIIPVGRQDNYSVWLSSS